MKFKTFEQYINEQTLSSIKAGEDSEVEVSDQKAADGKIISAQEILGQILNADTEDSFKAYFYEKYGSTKFDTETMSQMVKYYNDYYKEHAEKEKEAEKEGGEGEGEEEDPLADL